ncbi:MAG TPA: SDR family oxidoreductase [Flavobacterium sp.]|nr:SDR family oxidoreductase [Flavobacterium sp.]
MPSALITGAGGFIGRRLCARLLKDGWHVRAVLRKDNLDISHGMQKCWVEDIGPDSDWQSPLVNMQIVIHLAARVHIIDEYSIDSLSSYREVNTAGTAALARQAAASGVKRFIFISSVKVNGEFSEGQAFSEKSVENPQDPYGISKWEAEQILKKISEETGMEVVIIRPPLVYGPGAKANFLRLMNWVDRGMPLPFSLIKNKRSLVFVENLVDAIVLAAQHPLARGKTYLVADKEDLSTPELVAGLGKAFDKKVWQLPVPVVFLNLVAAIVNKKVEVNRLTSSLQIDSSAIRKELGWKQPFSTAEGLEITVQHYLKSLKSPKSNK